MRSTRWPACAAHRWSSAFQSKIGTTSDHELVLRGTRPDKEGGQYGEALAAHMMLSPGTSTPMPTRFSSKSSLTGEVRLARAHLVRRPHGARHQPAMVFSRTAGCTITWSLSVQREIMKSTSLEVRYLGTRALELPVQLQLNSISPFELGAQPLPTYLSQSDIPANVPATAPTLQQFLALRTRRFAADGFTGGVITEEAAVGDSTYHGGAVELLHRFSRGLMLRANYTFAKTMDNSTNDLNTSAVNPRRPQD